MSEALPDIAAAVLAASKGRRVLFVCDDYSTANVIFGYAREICSKAFNNAIAERDLRRLRFGNNGVVQIADGEFLDPHRGIEWDDGNAIALAGPLGTWIGRRVVPDPDRIAAEPPPSIDPTKPNPTKAGKAE